MSRQDRAIARACLDQVMMGMAEVRQILPWWSGLSSDRQREFKEFAASCAMYHAVLKE